MVEYLGSVVVVVVEEEEKGFNDKIFFFLYLFIMFSWEGIALFLL